MSITHNGKEYGATKVINYSAAPDYNRGVTVDNIQSGNYQATDNGFLFIQLQSQQSNPTKVSVIRSKTPITDTGTEIASIVLSQYQYSETLTAQVMAREYYKLTIDGAGNPQVLSCTFYPYTSNVPIKLTENITMEQVEGLESELAGKQDAGDYATNTALNNGLAGKQNKGDYATSNELTQGLETKQDKGNYFNKNTDILDIAHGGHGGTTKEQAQKNLGINDFKINRYERLDLNKAKNGVLVGRPDYLENKPSNLIDSGEIIVETVLGPDSTTFTDNGPYSYHLQTYRSRAGFAYAQRTCQPIGVVGEWKLMRNHDGSIPADLINLPVGFIYIQLRGQSTPDQLFGSNGKWQDISSTYAGEFFRAVGGNSASFGSKQNEGLPNIEGSTEYARDLGILYGGAESVPTTTGAFYKGARTNGTFQPGKGGSNYFLSFQASRSNSIYGSSTHVTPYNSAIRIWKKIS